MKNMFNGLKRFWNEIQAVVDPKLIAVTNGDIIVDWIDVRTGERPWFS